MDISIIIPNYNGARVLEKNLPKVLEAIRGYKEKVDIIVSDDASSDTSLEVIKKFPVKIVENTKNDQRGFSSNINRAVAHATGEILLLLNTDVIPQKGFLEPLLTHFTNPEVFAVGCMDQSIENNKKVLRGVGVGRWEKGFFMHSAGNIEQYDTLWVNGGSGAFRKSIWRKIGGLEELYDPFYWEDIDLSYRAQKEGFQVIFEPKSIVIHEHEKGSIKTQFQQKYVTKIAYRNQFLFVWLNVTDASLIVSHLLWLPYHLINALIHRDGIFLLGFCQAFIKLPRVMKIRKRNKKHFVKKDREIVS